MYFWQMLRCFIFIFLLPFASFAQMGFSLSEASQVSLVTCGPGEELYEAFGHTAIRIHDPAVGFDAVYNYGTFDFDQPNFYWNFVQGRSMYMLAVNRYEDFVRAYEYYNRSVREQFLNMTLAEKQALFDKLTWNAKKENREYLYDYFFDNCSTRPRDIIMDAMGGTVEFDTTYLGSDRLSIRQLTDLYIAREQPWGDLGIDLCLGARIDKPATAMQYMYLPEKLEEAFDHAYVVRGGESQPLVEAKQITFKASPEVKEKSWFVPQVVFVAFLLISAVFVTIFRFAGRSTRIFDGVVFMLTSFFGWNGIFLWFFTNHFSADYNWNILWALPTNAIFGYALLKKNRPKWTRPYSLFLIVLYAGLLVGWNYLPQMLHPSLRFIVILLLYLAVGVFRQSGPQIRRTA
ncbi:MAG: DUF4105 domain-containing protein [Flavobacteriales bacterium]|nr:DUF4105 domain-containing protein [Flavobacteriales bacterium]